MSTFSFKVHSFVDLITNSSTSIFTNYSGSVDVAKALINEILKVSGHTGECEDYFTVCSLYDPDVYFDLYPELVPEEFEDWDWSKQANYMEKIQKGELPKPNWFFEIEKEFDEGEMVSYDQTFHIFPKKKEYTTLAKLIVDLVESPEYEADMN